MSPKNKGKFGKGKPAIETEDEFVSGVNSFLHKLKPFAKQLIIGCVVVLVAVFAAVGYTTYRQHQEERATELYDSAVLIYQQPVMSAEEAELIKSLNLPNTPADMVTHDTVEARANAALAALDKLQSSYGSTGVAEQARLFHAGVLFDAGRYDDALAMYRKVASADGAASQRAIAREGIGYALEAKALAAADPAARQQGLEEALAAFQKVQPKDDGVYRDYALYHQARLLQSLERNAEAVELYNKVLATQPTTPLRSVITQRLAVLQVPAANEAQ